MADEADSQSAGAAGDRTIQSYKGAGQAGGGKDS